MTHKLFGILILMLTNSMLILGQINDRKVISNGIYRITYDDGEVVRLFINDSLYEMKSASQVVEKGSIDIDHQSFFLYADTEEDTTEFVFNTVKQIPVSKNGIPLEINVKGQALKGVGCNCYELEKPLTKSSRFVLYGNGGIRVTCRKGVITKIKKIALH
ncbi:hypothetical protein [Flammeovirga aprica]|uniref:Uncharacterized protein n=1 Tax=Flammeovirga aprica JL-4 TaxID=694437 RepID=A0A7X9RZT8_9BACT|nr:hypothetical protein [Flammeovirga aprica]NME71736.1 hypothetical protein [Flammeovirga aprica JL-4]